jgi:hypothetical protein
MKLETLTFDQIYLIFINDYLTIEKMAEDYKVHPDLLRHWIECGKPDTNKDWAEFQNNINELYYALTQ